MNRECAFCGRQEGPFMPLPGSPTDEGGEVQDVTCYSCYEGIVGPLEAWQERGDARAVGPLSSESEGFFVRNMLREGR